MFRLVIRRRNRTIMVERTMPRRILVMEMLHQIPLSPKEVRHSTMASGIRLTTSSVVATEGGSVRPKPANPPAVTISTHMGI